jgi:hypothetical protein
MDIDDTLDEQLTDTDSDDQETETIDVEALVKRARRSIQQLLQVIWRRNIMD